MLYSDIFLKVTGKQIKIIKPKKEKSIASWSSKKGRIKYLPKNKLQIFYKENEGYMRAEVYLVLTDVTKSDLYKYPNYWAIIQVNLSDEYYITYEKTERRSRNYKGEQLIHSVDETNLYTRCAQSLYSVIYSAHLWYFKEIKCISSQVMIWTGMTIIKLFALYSFNWFVLMISIN